MATHKHIDAVCVLVTALTLLIAILFINGKALGIEAVPREEDSGAMFTENDLDMAWNVDNATEITLSDDGSIVHGNGAYASGGDVHIVYAGKYVISGGLSDGTIRIEADGDDKIRLMLDGVSINCEDDAAIRVEQAGKVFIVLKSGTENVISSGASYDGEAVSAGVDGTIYSRDDLTIGGTGSLKVTAAYRHGIVCNDDFVITGGTIDVTAPQDTIHANDSVRVREAAVLLSAGDDGITVSNDDETAFLYMESGNIQVSSCTEGLEAVQITIAGGTLGIAATDDGLNANGYSGNSVINITGGDITVTVENGRDADGIDSNKDIHISGGSLFVSVNGSGGNNAIDYGSEYGGTCEISGGTVLACGSSGMAEGFDQSSTQGFLMQAASATAGTTVTVSDAGGNELISGKVPCGFSSVLVSAPGIKAGDTYTLLIGESRMEVTANDSAGLSGVSGGTRPGKGGFGGGRGGLNGTGLYGNTGDAATDNNPGDIGDGNNGADGGTRPDAPPGTGGFGGQFGGNMGDAENQGGMQHQGNTQNQGNASTATGAESTVSAEDILLLCISSIILLGGCIIAFLYKRR